jgi:hypothetical protein
MPTQQDANKYEIVLHYTQLQMIFRTNMMCVQFSSCKCAFPVIILACVLQ